MKIISFSFDILWLKVDKLKLRISQTSKANEKAKIRIKIENEFCILIKPHNPALCWKEKLIFSLLEFNEMKNNYKTLQCQINILNSSKSGSPGFPMFAAV